MSGLYTEADYENSVIELFRNDLGYEYAYGPDIERDFYNPLYEEVLLDALYQIASVSFYFHKNPFLFLQFRAIVQLHIHEILLF